MRTLSSLTLAAWSALQAVAVAYLTARLIVPGLVRLAEDLARVQ